MDREAAFGVFGDALGIADEHVDDAVNIADAGDVVVEWQRARCTDDVYPWPQFLAGRIGSALLIGPGDERSRVDRDAFVGE